MKSQDLIPSGLLYISSHPWFFQTLVFLLSSTLPVPDCCLVPAPNLVPLIWNNFSLSLQILSAMIDGLTATGSRQGEIGLLQSPQPEASPETQHQEQWKPDLEDKQQGTCAGRPPFKSKSPQCEFTELLLGQKESLGVSPLQQGPHPWVRGEVWIRNTYHICKIW